MKHILNNLTEEEKNSIRQQHIGGMNVVNENFNKLIDSKLGDVQPLINEDIKASNGEYLKQIQKNSLIDPTRATDARGQGTGVHKSNVGYTTIKSFNFGKDKMETGSDLVKKDTPEYKKLVKSMNGTSKSKSGKKYKVTVTGGASAVGSSSGYDNNALAKRRAEKLVQSLKNDVPGLNDKFQITITPPVVGTATKLNSPEAYKEQFVKISVELPQEIADKSFWESDSTVTVKGGGLPSEYKKNNEFIHVDPINDTKTTICVTIPTGYRKQLINMLYEFKIENNINLSYKEQNR